VATLTHLPEAAFRKMPWRNGGGETSEIAVFPAAANLDDFVWRISSATVRQSGVFSQFPGIDRTLCVVEGAGIDLAFPDAITEKLDLSSVPYRFAGELYVKGTVVPPGIVDFNAMTRRSAARHTVARRHIVAGTDIAVPGDFLLVYTSRCHSLRVAALYRMPLRVATPYSSPMRRGRRCRSPHKRPA
jgi:hypothetical protein